MDELQFLIGNWNTRGEMKATNDNPASVFTGTDTYEWILDGHFILHKVDVMMDGKKVEALEFIGLIPEKDGSYKMRSFDNQGNLTEMEAHLESEIELHINGDKMRSKLFVIDNNTLKASWERSNDNENWIPWMELKLTR